MIVWSSRTVSLSLCPVTKIGFRSHRHIHGLIKNFEWPKEVPGQPHSRSNAGVNDQISITVALNVHNICTLRIDCERAFAFVSFTMKGLGDEMTR